MTLKETDVLHDALLALHILGLMLGAGGGFGSMLAMRLAPAAPPEQGAGIRSLGPHLARMSSVGLALMLLTGIALVLVSYGGFATMPPLFWVKMLFVTTLTGAAIAMELTYAGIKEGKIKPPGRLPILGPIAGASSLLAVAFAVFTFH